MSDLRPKGHPGQGARLATLQRPSDALGARLACIDGAARTLDLQYYSWAADGVGYLFIDRVVAAADRGVSVRILVDDINLLRSTRSVASLCVHPNIEIKVFNPWGMRTSASIQGLEFALSLKKLNRRMHNKLMVVDGERAIFGGRNVGDEYFGLDEVFNFVDFDAFLAGPEVRDLAELFEAYWESPGAVPGSALTKSVVTEVDLLETRGLIAEELVLRAPLLGAIVGDEAGSQQEIPVGRPLAIGSVRVVFDAVAEPTGRETTQVVDALRETAELAGTDLIIVTPFFVPDDDDIDWYRRTVSRGVRVRLLTNSLASNPGTISNSGLKKQRAAVVDAGVELFELRADAAAKHEWEISPQVGRYLGLHAKLFVFDGGTVFVGSLNLDPRSMLINTETGVFVEDSQLGAEISHLVLRLMAPENSWRVTVGSEGGLLWSNDTEIRRRQPARHSRQRFTDFVFGLLPIRRHI
jgi:putative cardiolipin synthase